MNKMIAAVAAMVLLVAGCGASEGTAQEADPVPGNPEAVRHFEEDIAAHIGVDGDGGEVTDPASGETCEAIIILPNKAMVDIYADAGDLVATNPDGTAGVKVGSSGDERPCFDYFTERLVDFPTT